MLVSPVSQEVHDPGSLVMNTHQDLEIAELSVIIEKPEKTMDQDMLKSKEDASNLEVGSPPHGLQTVNMTSRRVSLESSDPSSNGYIASDLSIALAKAAASERLLDGEGKSHGHHHQMHAINEACAD